MEDFLSFRRMITPVLIQILFWAGSAVSILFGLAALARGEGAMGLVFVIFGPILIRIYCELMILFFRMNETLTDIRTATTGSSSSTAIPSNYQPARTVPKDQIARPGWMQR